MRRFLAALTFCLMAALIQITAVAMETPQPGLAGNTWLLQDVDREGSVGTYCSLDVDSAGDAHISYFSGTDGTLKYAKSTDAGWALQVVDNSSYVGSSTSLEVDAMGNPHISYYDYGNRDLKYAKWTGSGWDIQTVDSEGNVGSSTSLALDAAGNPHIAYHGSDVLPISGLKYARWTGSQWETQIVDYSFASRLSLALDTNGNPHISFDGGGSPLWYVYWTGNSWSKNIVDTARVWDNSLALDAQGRPYISYAVGSDWDLRYAHWTGTAWLIETVDSYSYQGDGNAIALDSHGVPHISYAGTTGYQGALKFASRTSSGWEIETVDYRNLSYTSLAIDLNDNPRISYNPGGELRYAEAVSQVPPTVTITPSDTPTAKATATATATPTHTATPAPTVTNTLTPTSTQTPTPTATRTSTAIQIPRAARRPVVDGNIDEWFGLAADVLNTDNASYIQGEAPTWADLSASLRAAWAPEGLYFAAAITDDILIGNDSPNQWHDDDIELALYISNSQAGGYPPSNRYAGAADDITGIVHQFSLCVDGRVVDLGAAPLAPLTYITRTMSGGWQLEVFVPVAALGESLLATDHVYPFNFALWDDDLGNAGRGQTHMFWQSDSTTAYNEHWGSLRLSGWIFDFPQSTETPIPTRTPTATSMPTSTSTTTRIPTATDIASLTPTFTITPTATSTLNPTYTPTDVVEMPHVYLPLLLR